MMSWLFGGGKKRELRNAALITAVRDRKPLNEIESHIRQGADPDGEVQGTSAMYVAVTEGLLDVVALFIENEANVNAFVRGASLFDHAMARRDKEMALKLIRSGAVFNYDPLDRELIRWWPPEEFWGTIEGVHERRRRVWGERDSDGI